MIPSTPEEKVEALAKLDAPVHRLAEQIQSLHNLAASRLEDRLISEARAQRGPRSKIKSGKFARRVLGDERAAEIVKEVSAECELETADLRQQLAEAKKHCSETIKHWTPQPSDIKRALLLELVFGSTYASQGLGASTYARARAELIAEEMRRGSPGIEIQVQAVPNLNPDTPKVRLTSFGAPRDFLVVGEVDTLVDAAIVKARREPMTLRESFMWCLSNGVNPRVYWPSLPHGYEDTAGIGPTGQDLRK